MILAVWNVLPFSALQNAKYWGTKHYKFTCSFMWLRNLVSRFKERIYFEVFNLHTVRPLYRTGVSLLSREAFYILSQEKYFII